MYWPVVGYMVECKRNRICEHQPMILFSCYSAIAVDVVTPPNGVTVDN